MDGLQNHNLLGFVSDPDDLQRTLQTCPTPKDKRKCSMIHYRNDKPTYGMSFGYLKVYLSMGGKGEKGSRTSLSYQLAASWTGTAESMGVSSSV